MAVSPHAGHPQNSSIIRSDHACQDALWLDTRHFFNYSKSQVLMLLTIRPHLIR